VEKELTRWLWSGYLAFGHLTAMDGEKGCAKTSITADVGARLTRGVPPPGASTAKDPVNIIVFTYESSVSEELRQRYEAAGADMGRVFIPDLEELYGIKKKSSSATRRRNGERASIYGLELPDNAHVFREMIRQANASLAIWDPINDFLAERIDSHKDASIRRALMPLGPILREQQCAGWMLRHMSQDTSARAKFRGLGTSAYQNRARVHLIASEIPEDLGQEAGYALAIVDSNMRKVNKKRSLAYDIVDSDVVADDEGFYAPRIEWRGMIRASADELTQRTTQRGPEAYVRKDIIKVLKQMFSEKDTWPATDIFARLAENDLYPDDRQKKAVKDEMMIRSFAGRGEMAGQWYWTIKPQRHHVKRAGG
jgi:hypothetical protein